MDNENLTSEELETISRLQMEKDEKEHYVERPMWQRVIAWVLLTIVVLGIVLYCRAQIVPQI